MSVPASRLASASATRYVSTRGRMPAGGHPFKWDGRDVNGAAVGAGIYLARLKSGGEERRLKLVGAN